MREVYLKIKLLLSDNQNIYTYLFLSAVHDILSMTFNRGGSGPEIDRGMNNLKVQWTDIICDDLHYFSVCKHMHRGDKIAVNLKMENF